MCLLSSPDRKWSKQSESIIRTKLQTRSNKLSLVTSDSKRTKRIKGEWLPGRMISIFRGKWVNFIEEVHKNKYGQ